MTNTKRKNLLISGSLSFPASTNLLAQHSKSPEEWLIYSHDHLLPLSPQFDSITFAQLISNTDQENLKTQVSSLIENVLQVDPIAPQFISYNRLERPVTAILTNHLIADRLLSKTPIQKIYLGSGTGIEVKTWRTIASHHGIPITVLPAAPIPPITAPEPPRFEFENETHPDGVRRNTPPAHQISTGSSRLKEMLGCDPGLPDFEIGFLPKKQIKLSALDSLKTIFHLISDSRRIKKHIAKLEDASKLPLPLIKLIHSKIYRIYCSELPKAKTRIAKATQYLKDNPTPLLLADTESGKDCSWTVAAHALSIPIIGYIYDAIPPQFYCRHYSHLIARSESAINRLKYWGHDIAKIHLSSSHEIPKKIIRQDPNKPQVVFLATWFGGCLYQDYLANHHLLKAAILFATANPEYNCIFKFHPPRLRHKRNPANAFYGFDQRDIDALLSYADSLKPPKNLKIAPPFSRFVTDYLQETSVAVTIESMAGVEAMYYEVPCFFLNDATTLDYNFPKYTETINPAAPTFADSAEKLVSIIQQTIRNPASLNRLAATQQKYAQRVYWPDSPSLLERISGIINLSPPANSIPQE